MDFIKTRLADCCIIKPPKSEAKNALKSDDLVSFVPMNQLGINQKNIELESSKKLSEVSGSYTYFADNDVLLAKITPCFENGKLGIAKNLTNGIGFGSSEFIVFRSKGQVEPEYLYYYLSQPSFRNLGQSVMTGAVGHKRVPKDFIENTEIPLPPIPEQKRIVAILDQAFADIDKARANAEKNLNNVRELFESYLQQVFSQRGEGWVETTLSKACSFSQGIQVGVNKQFENNANGRIRFLRIVDFTQGNETPRFIAFPGDKYTVLENDVSLVRYGASAGFVCTGLEGCIANNLFKVIPRSEGIKTTYLYYYLYSSVFQSPIQQVIGGAAMPALSFNMINDLIFSYPDVDEQIDIVIDVEKFQKKTKTLEAIYKDKLSKLDELKKSILQKAFTGELTKQKQGAAA